VGQSVIKSNAYSGKITVLCCITKACQRKFKGPKRDDKVITLTGQQVNWLLDGYDISTMKGHEKLHCEAVF
jgi:hypothetical protein